MLQNLVYNSFGVAKKQKAAQGTALELRIATIPFILGTSGLGCRLEPLGAPREVLCREVRGGMVQSLTGEWTTEWAMPGPVVDRNVSTYDSKTGVELRH